jgi:hypothetical protein
MNIIPAGLSSPRMGLRVFMLLLAWIMVVSLSWADLLERHAEVGGALSDLQQATEPDLDEMRHDTAIVWLVEEGLTGSVSIRPESDGLCPLLAVNDTPLPTRSFLSKLSVYRL